MKSSSKAIKKFIGEKAYNVIQNTEVDLNKLKDSLITSTNARAVFQDLNESQIKEIIYSISNEDMLIKIKETNQEEIKEAFAKAGYNVVIFDDYNAIKECEKYYANGERICTYNNLQNRMNQYHMLVAIKKDIDLIERSKKPERDDEYGTSILNIQIAKNGSHISIKNRYNHTVSNGDSTLNNNLNNIYKGLQEMVLGYYNFASSNFNSKNYTDIVVINNVYLKYDLERNNVYYGDFVLSAENGIQYNDKSRYSIKTNSNEYNNYPLIFDFKDKKVIGDNNKSTGFERLMKDRVITQEHQEVKKAIVRDAKKELLQYNKNVLKHLYKNFKYDFNKEYHIDMIVGSFTENSLQKTINCNKGILLICDIKYNELKCVEFKNNKFYIESDIYSNKWKWNGSNIIEFYRKSDFNDLRKNNIITYVIYQDEKYKVNKITTKAIETPTLQERLKRYKSEKRQQRVNEYDYNKMYKELETEFYNFKSLLVEKITKSDLSNFDEVMSKIQYSASRISREINYFTNSMNNKSFISVESAIRDFENIKEMIQKQNNALNGLEL